MQRLDERQPGLERQRDRSPRLTPRMCSAPAARTARSSSSRYVTDSPGASTATRSGWRPAAPESQCPKSMWRREANVTAVPVGWTAGRRVRGHPLRALGRRHREGHDRPPGGAQRVPPADDRRDLRRARARARGHVDRRDRAHRRGAAGVLLRRRPARARRHRLHAGGRVGRALPRDRPARPDPPAAQAGRGDGGRLRDRRRPDPAPRLRPHDRGRQRALRPDRARASARGTAATARGCCATSSARRRRRSSGSCAASTTRRRRSTMGLVNTVVPLERLEEETVAWCREMLALSPFALRLAKASFNAHEDGYAGIQQLAHDANLLFYGARRRRRDATPTRRSARPTSRGSRSGRERRPSGPRPPASG